MGRDDPQRHRREHDPPADEDGAAATSRRIPPRRGRVVAADDEPHLSFLVRVVLEGAGFEVVEAPNGEVALELVAAAPTQLVVTDRMMPVMNGTTLVARLRADPRTASIPIMMVSANPDRNAAVDAFLNKPFATDELVRLAEQLTTTTHEGISS